MSNKISNIIVKNIADKLSVADKLTMEQKVEQLPELNSEQKANEAVWELANYYNNAADIDVNAEWKKFYKNNIASQSTIDTAVDNERRLPTKKSWLRIAASIAIIATVGALSWYVLNKPTSNNIVYYDVTAPMGSRTQVTLSDSTKVWLNAGSSVRYSNLYNKEIRSVELRGEAYFEVTPNKNVPFVVNAVDLRIKVLGTAFNVKAYDSDSTIETTLVHGSVALQKFNNNSPISDEFILKPKQKLTYIKSDTSNALNTPVKFLVKNVSDLSVETAWTQGRLVFEAERLDQISKILERKFNIEIAFNNATTKSLKYSGKLDDLSLEQILAAISLTSPVNYSINKKMVTIFLK